MLADLLAVEKRMKVFVLGATGYIGGAVAHALVQDGHEVSGLSRSTDKAEQLRLRGVSPTIGTLFDREILVKTARAADAVVNAADSDNAYAVTALLEAFAATDKRIVHTSGSSIVGDRAGGQLADSIYDDDSRPNSRLEKQGRTAIDDAILREATNGVVICPTMVYGVGTGLHTESVQIPILARLARELGAGVHIGAGNNRWSNVQIEDLVNLYRLALTDAPVGAFLFAENGEASMRELAAAIGERLGFYGPTISLSPEEGIRRLGADASEFALGSNSRVRAIAARTLGWHPQHNDLIEGIRSGKYAV
jgi:nucleoside-diphosphate-sugar epimerase